MNKRCMLIMSHKSVSHAKQQGSAIVLAIFVIIIISLLGAALVSLQRDSARGTSYEVYASRAYLSAYSASELALLSLFPLNTSAAVTTNCTGALISAPLGNDKGFHGCTAEYTCQILPPTNSAALPTRYRVESTGVCKNAQTTARRQMMVEAVNF